jgi:methionine synthase II (cobalamin-independent)
MLKTHSLTLTVVGSLPRLAARIDDSIKEAVNLQVRLGYSIVSDGEQRADMISYFESLPGLARISNEIVVSGRIEPFEDPDEFVKVRDYRFVKDYLATLKADVQVKTSLTGPVTLGFTCAARSLGVYYRSIDDERLYSDLAQAIKPIMIRLLELGSLVQIDEPGISAGYLAPEFAVSILRRLFDDLPEDVYAQRKVSLHTCGSLNQRLVSNLLRVEVPILSVALSGAEGLMNLHFLPRKLLTQHRKALGAGCVPVTFSDTQSVDTSHKISLRISEILDSVGAENVAYIHPNCGLRNLPRDVAETILLNLSQAVKQYTSMS